MAESCLSASGPRLALSEGRRQCRGTDHNCESQHRAGPTGALFRACLEDHGDELRSVDLDLAAFVCATSIETLAHTAVLHPSEMLSHEAIGKLVDETTRLVVGYLQYPIADPRLTCKSRA